MNLKLSILFFFNLTFCLSCFSQNSKVFINGTPLTNSQISSLENLYQVKIQNGRYWYDAKCGLWGMEGQGIAGLILPNLKVGGSLKAKASNGKTNIFINGRQINYTEMLQWKQLFGYVTPGRYWLDAYGNLGIENGVYLLNVPQLMAQSRSKNSFWRSTTTDIGTGGSGSSFYVIGKDFSYSNF